jgi:GTP-binding protein HflX
LETDRRIIRRRIQKIQGELDKVKQQRGWQLGRRKKAGIPMATLVGYTNAGKSTLFNALSAAGVEAEDQLFSTLDPVTRRIRLPSGGELLLSDTVGFIQKLSPTVVAAFRATLEELSGSDVLLHVVDVNHSKAVEQAEVVDETLEDLGLQDKPRLVVMNKMDLLQSGANGANGGVGRSLPNPGKTPPVMISAAKKWNLDSLLETLEACLVDLEGPLTVVAAGTRNQG